MSQVGMEGVNLIDSVDDPATDIVEALYVISQKLVNRKNCN